MFALCTHVTFCWPVSLFGSEPEWDWACLAVVLESKVKGEADDTLGLGASRDLEVLYDTGVTLVLEPSIFSLGVLTDDRKVDVVVTRREAADRLAEHDGGVDV